MTDYRTTDDHRRWALERVELLARSSYESQEPGQRSEPELVDDVVEELTAKDDLAYTAALIRYLSAFLGAYMHRIASLTNEPGEAVLSELVTATREQLGE
jgi:hypothetical protein